MEVVNKQIIPYLMGLLVVFSCCLSVLEFMQSYQAQMKLHLTSSSKVKLNQNQINTIIGVHEKPYIQPNIIRMRKGDYSQFDYTSIIHAYTYNHIPLTRDQFTLLNTLNNQAINVLQVKITDIEGHSDIVSLIVLLEGQDSDEVILNYAQGVRQ